MKGAAHEWAILRTLEGSANIIGGLDVFISSCPFECLLVMEVASATLASVLQADSVAHALAAHMSCQAGEDTPTWGVLRGLAGGVHALHRRGLAHRDLKPANLLFVSGILKIADMGLTVAEKHSAAEDATQTRWWRAPEVFLRGVCRRPADQWSVGAIACEVCGWLRRRGEAPSHRPAFEGRDEPGNLFNHLAATQIASS